MRFNLQLLFVLFIFNLSGLIVNCRAYSLSEAEEGDTKKEDLFKIENVPKFDVKLYLNALVIYRFNEDHLGPNRPTSMAEYEQAIFSNLTTMLHSHNAILSIVGVKRVKFWKRITLLERILSGYFRGFFEVDGVDFIIVADDLTVETTKVFAYTDKLCTNHSIIMVDFGHSSNFDVRTVTETIAYGLGRLMGFDYMSGEENCTCGFSDTSSCIMKYPIDPWPGKMFKTFDSCNMEKKKRELEKMECLSPFDYTKRHYTVCGDGLQDEGEECDCGFQGQCAIPNDSPICCTSECKFANEQYQCDRGGCCKNCMILKKNTRCRKAKAICYLPDVCDGISRNCKRLNAQKEDNSPCDDNRGYCDAGECFDLEDKVPESYRSQLFFNPNKCDKLLNDMWKKSCEENNNENSKLLSISCPNKSNISELLICEIPHSFIDKKDNFYSDKSIHCEIKRFSEFGEILKSSVLITNDLLSNGKKNDCKGDSCTNSVPFGRCSNDACEYMNSRFPDLQYSKIIFKLGCSPKQNDFGI